MTCNNTTIGSAELRELCQEDPDRAPLEKETGIHIEGDAEHFSVTSFKRVVFLKLLQRPEFQVKHLVVINDDGTELTVDSLDTVVEDQSLTIIGVVGRLPVGTISIGTARKDNSHADIVK